MNLKNKELEIGGLSFGITSGVITTLGMIVGIDSATDSKLAIVASILALAVADSLSDALGMHIEEESRLDELGKPIWVIALYTFLAKFTFSLIFIIPFFLLATDTAVLASIIFGGTLVFLLSIFVARRSKRSIAESILEHMLLTAVVIAASYFVGKLAERFI